jgi:hypothetical protein
MADGLVTVETYRSLPEAEAARIHLAAEGISAFLADAETVNMDWLLGDAVGGIKLQVPAGVVERTARLLGEVRRQRSERPEEPQDAEETVCLACGTALAAGETRCRACGWSYAGGEPA